MGTAPRGTKLHILPVSGTESNFFLLCPSISLWVQLVYEYTALQNFKHVI